MSDEKKFQEVDQMREDELDIIIPKWNTTVHRNIFRQCYEAGRSRAIASQAARIAELEATNQRLIDSYEHNRECTLAGWKDSREKVAELEAELTKLKGIFKND